MNQLIINYKYRVGQVVFFMYKNEIRKGVVAKIDFNIQTKTLETGLIKQIVNHVKRIFDEDYPFERVIARYSLDLVSKEGNFESSPHLTYEYDVYATQKDLIHELSLK